MPVIVDPDSHLMGAIGIAELAMREKSDQVFSLDMRDVSFETIGRECKKCPNHCEVLNIYKNHTLVDTWGNKCEAGLRE